MSEASNPFAALLEAPEAQSSSKTNSCEGGQSVKNDKTSANSNCDYLEEHLTINNIVENIFHITINPEAVENTAASNNHLIYLEELANALKPNIYIDLETLEQALFERLLLKDPETLVIPKTANVYLDHVVEKQLFPYLFNSMQAIQNYEHTSNPIIKECLVKMKELILRNAVTGLKQPAIFYDQDIPKQLVELLKLIDVPSHSFFEDIVKELMSQDRENKEVMRQFQLLMFDVLHKIRSEVLASNIINLPIYVLPTIQLFASNLYLGNILMNACEVKPGSNGKQYSYTIIGALLSLSVLPKSDKAEYEFFDTPVDSAAVAVMETSLWNAALHLTNNLHKTFLTLLKGGPQMRSRILTWIGKCLSANTERGKIGHGQAGLVDTCVSDGFMLNLGAVLLQLCQPFCTTSHDPKSLKIDPTYAAVPPAECEAKSVHLTCLHKETCLLPPRENASGQAIPRPSATTYNFVTECFYMTQKCIDLGVRVCAEKLFKAGQDATRARQMLVDVAASAQHLVDPITERSKVLMVKFVSLRCALLEQNMLSNLGRLQATTCAWLVQVAIHDTTYATNYAPMEFLPVNMPIMTSVPDTLRCVPEFVVENIVVLITTARRTSPVSEIDLTGVFQPALTLVLTFMGDSRRTYNPHLRARLAECLEALIPHHPEEQTHQMTPTSQISTYFKEQMFKEHPHRLQLVPCLLNVFVGIEMTGQSVQFEQKFNYRRPMYIVMDFLWEIEEHRNIFTQLALETEANMEAVRPPIFLCFVNLLMNDAIFLLDEALSNMAQIRTLQALQASAEWTQLSETERQQRLGSLTHTGMMARFDNLLGRDTVRTLVKLTQLAPFVFCHPTLVDRIASMLNYFLLRLVGPNQKDFKVKDKNDYDFKPKDTVLDICTMYVELGVNDRFCAAVSDDGRSYSPQLFALAQQVLARIGGCHLISPLEAVSQRVIRASQQRQQDEVLLANAPEEFLDPIMSTLMMDPVTLPSSRTTVDRTTIARHLLSDQTDPFNRSSLSMDQVRSNTELKERIHAWIAQLKGQNDQNQEST